MPYCSNCGADVREDTRYCPDCGSPVGDQSSNAEPGDEEPTAGREREANTESILDYAIGYPRRNGWGTILIGGVLTLFWILIIPIFLTAGYFVRLTEAAATRQPNPPRFEQWGDLLKLGVLVVVAFVPLLIIVGVLAAAFGSVNEGLSAIVVLAGYYVGPAIFMRFAVTQRIGATYDVDALVALLTSRTYVVGLLIYIVAAVLGAIAATIVSLLSVLTVVGWIIIIPMTMFYLSAFLYTILGRIYMKIDHEQRGEAEATGTEV